MVSERLGAESFAEQYYRLYTDDMPVYVTSDSVLHAWHRSFDAFLVDLEEQELLPLLQSILDKTRSVGLQLLTALGEANETFARVLRDVDLFLTVAQSELEGQVPANTQDSNSLTTLLASIGQQKLSTADLFSCAPRDVDFSLFKPRGHYTKSEKLTRFFRAMTWLGTIDLRIDGTDDKTSDLRQLQCACVLVHLLREAQVVESVDTLQSIISTITGDGVGADNMTPMQLHALLGDRDVVTLYCGPTSDAALKQLQDEIANRGLGTQAIAGHPITESAAAAVSPSTPTRLPTSFAFFGQQFVWSAFVFSKLVYDQVLQDDAKVVRRVPSAVDAVFALFGNDVASGEIARRMTANPKTSDDFVAFRDGAPYASNLVALRRQIDEQLSQADPTTCSLALLWQLTLRELSTKSASDADVFQSDVWKKRQMNTQIASFTQLRHDTILYAKQSFTMGTRCEYAAGFVDPYPAFWTKIQQLGERTLGIIGDLNRIKSGIQDADDSDDDDESPLQYKAKDFFQNFVEVASQLKAISTAQCLKQKLTEEQDEFIKNVMEERHGSGASRYLGWYPSLFYTQREDSGKQDHLVADIHTDSPSVEHGDPGGVLHLGVGDVNLGFFVVDKVVYAGPVFSSYEFVTKINERLTDEEFSKRLHAFQAPQWARESFLVAE